MISWLGLTWKLQSTQSDDLVIVANDLYVTEHLVVSNEIAGVKSLACIDGDLHVVADAEFVLVGVDSLVADVDEGFLMKHYVQFVPGSDHDDWMVEIVFFDKTM